MDVMKPAVGAVNKTEFSCHLYTQGNHKLRNRCPCFLTNHFIHLDCDYSVTTEQMSKILDFLGGMFCNKQLNASTI